MSVLHFLARSPRVRLGAGVALALLVLAVTAVEPLASAKTDKAAVPAPAKPTGNDWKQLSATQRSALSPLEKDWPRLDHFRREKWIELANRFSTMSPDEQARMQERMRDWVTLSPEQRRLARENYARVKKLSVEKSAQWEQYQQLPEEKRRELASTSTPKKPLVNPPRREPLKPVVPRTEPAKPKAPAVAPAAVVPTPIPENANGVSQTPAAPVQSSPSTP